MNLPKRFLRIHTLTPCSTVHLDRDESGLAERMTLADRDRIRSSPQSLNRNLRTAFSPMIASAHSLRSIDSYTMPVRSRRSVQEKVILPLTGQLWPR